MALAGDLHVVVFPWSAFGHLIPFLELSIALARSGVRVSFVSTPRNIQRLPPPTTDLITFVPIPLPRPRHSLADSHLPENAEATIDLPFDKVQHLKAAYDLLRAPLMKFVAENSPDWLIVDFSAPWAAEIARDQGVRMLYYVVFTAASSSFIGGPGELVGDRRRLRSTPESLMSPPEWVRFPSTVAYRKYEAPYVLAGIYDENNASGVSDAQRVAKTLEECEAVAIRSCPEFEAEYLNLFQSLVGKPVIPVGLLPPEKPVERSETAKGAWSSTFEWLDRQRPKTVVFVGFGSECKLSKEQIHEIASGLELSGLPFLWALRKPDWAAADEDAEDVLPEGFGRRTAGRGAVRTGWAPQREILAHPSIGGTLFHSGWGSAIEALQYGISLVVLPLIVDQPLNARLLVDKGLAVEVERGEEDGLFGADGVAKAVKAAMLAVDGAAAREAAAATFGDQRLHGKYVEEFVEFLKKHKPN